MNESTHDPESIRLGSLRDLGILDSPAEAEFDALVQAASLVCGTPISLISLVDETRQWFKANTGLPGVTETPREHAFCAHAILGEDVMEVPDATDDARFAENPLVTGAPNIRFYAGAPIRLRNGSAIGTLCVIDRQARRMDAHQLEILRCLARTAGYAIEDWRARREQIETAQALLESQSRLRRTEAFLNRVGRVAGIGGFEFDLLTGEGVASAEAYRMSNVAPSDHPVPSLQETMEFFAPEARPVAGAALHRAMQGEGGWDLVLPFIPVDRPQIWVRTVGSVEMEDGRPVRLTGTAQDVSDRVARRQTLERTLERLSLATESCDIGIWDWDIAEDAMHWDARMRCLYGLCAEHPVSRPEVWSDHLHPEDCDRAVQAIRDALDGTREFNTEFRVTWPDGTVRDIAATGRVTRDAAGKPLRMVGANWDITERRAAEALRAAHAAVENASRAKSEFLATMSHEIRSPLSGLIGVVDLLRASGLNGEQARMAKMVHVSAAMLLAVLNDILDFSKIEAGALAVAPVAIELRALIEEMAQPLRLAAAHKRLDFDVLVAPGLPKWLMLDGLRLRQILNNLIANAIKFTAAGGIRLDVTAAADGRLRFDVTDTGIGMSAEVVAQLFTPFMQADSSTSRRFGGSGLGLSISHKLAGLMGGALTVTSRLGEGSVFCLTLPLAACAPARDVAADANETVPPALPPSTRVLVVDDDPTIRWLSQQQLLKLGVSAEAAEDGVVALARLQAERFDLLLTDCHMPGLDGVALACAVRSHTQARLNGLPIIGVTADVTEAQRNLCLAAGMNELAIKPLTTERLAYLLQRHLSPLAADSPPPEAPALRRIAFDDQIFLSIFTVGDPEGAAWLGEYLDSAQQQAASIAALLAQDADTNLRRPELASHAHRLAGASFSVGAMLLGDAARALELASPLASPCLLRAQLDTVNQQLAAAAAAMRTEAVLF